MGSIAIRKNVMSQLDRIEQKLDRLLQMFGGAMPERVDVKAAIFASGGIEALKAHCKAESNQKAQGGKR